ncbi:MAG: hypothetical protein ACI955_002778 [Zhongshania sp.]|jgi:hypothetical protein
MPMAALWYGCFRTHPRAGIGNKRTVKNMYFDESRMLIYDLNAVFCGKFGALAENLSDNSTLL